MNFNEFVFIVQLAVFVLVFLATLYNVLEQGTFFDIKKGVILLILILLTFFIGVSIVMTDAAQNQNDTNLAYGVFFNIQAALLVLYVIFFIIEVFYTWRDVVQKRLEPRNSMKERQASR